VEGEAAVGVDAGVDDGAAAVGSGVGVVGDALPPPHAVARRQPVTAMQITAPPKLFQHTFRSSSAVREASA
jgi:hypothetical protein